MCIALFVYDIHPTLLLLLAFNRDEFWDRPTLPAHFWPDEQTLLAGRDALRKGTWLGMTRSGRFAFLTNYREPMNQSYPVIPSSTDGTAVAAAAAAADAASGGSQFLKTTTAPSRGALTTDFLTGTMQPLEYLQTLNTSDYCGFNLLVGDLQQQQLAYLSNRDSSTPRVLPPGIYGVSNGLLQQWPKVHKGLSALAHCIDLPAPATATAAAAAAASQAGAAAAAQRDTQQQEQQQEEQQEEVEECGPDDGDETVPWQDVFKQVMGDINKAAACEVPLTGVGEELDRRLSSIFVEPFEIQPGSKYGTRSQTVIAVWRDGRVEQRERYVERRQADGQPDTSTSDSSTSQPEAAAQAGASDDSEWRWYEVQHTFNMTTAGGGGEEAVAGAAGGMQCQAAAVAEMQQQASL